MITFNPVIGGHLLFWSLSSFTLFLIVPTIAAPDLEWKAAPGRKPEHPLLFLWGTVTAVTLYRLYGVLYKRQKDLEPTDLAAMPVGGTPLGERLWDYLKVLSNKAPTLAELKDSLALQDRITEDSIYTLEPEWREELARTIGQVICRFDELETLHEEHLDGYEQTVQKLRDLMALPDEEKLEDIMNLTTEALILAKHCRAQFKTWYPNDTDLSGDHIWLEIHTEIDRLQILAKDAEHDLKIIEGITLRQYGQIPTIWDNLETLIEQTKHRAQSYPAAVHDVYPNLDVNIIDDAYLKGLLTSLKANADLTPIGNLLLPSARPVPLTPPALAHAIQTELNKLRDSIQSVYPQEKLEDFNNIDVFLRNATNWAKRATRYYAGMSGVQPTGDQQTLTLRQIWNEIPAGARPLGQDCPTDLDQFRQWLNTVTRPVGVPQAGCNHPAELATELADPITQDWNTSLAHVRRLVNQPPAGNPPVPVPPINPPANQEPLFRTSDIPKFGDEDDYWTYRRAMTIFCQSVQVAPAQLTTAIARIIASYSGERRKTVMAFNLNEIYLGNWDATWSALLAYLDNHFLPTKAWLTQYNLWTGLRYSDKLWGRDFVSLYIREHGTLNQIAQVQGKRTIPEPEAVQKLADRIPFKVKENLQHAHHGWEAEANQRQVYDWIIEEWEHAKNLGLLEKAPKSSQNPAPARNMNVPLNSPAPAGSPRIDWPNLICDKPCFDSQPPVHPSLRGPWRDIPEDKKRGLHGRCRRPVSEHGHGIKGCPRPGNHINHQGTNADPASIARQITQGNNEDLQLTSTASNSGNE
ncbi:hypothetical protein FP744_10000001 [Trichoderma asperellum]